MKHLRLFLFTLPLTLPLTLTLSGCYTAAPRDVGELQPLPEAYASAPESETLSGSADAWWLSFGRDDLNALQSLALSDNLDIAQAWARLRQSEASALQAGADLYPHVSLGSAYARAWRERGDVAVNDYSAQLSLSYELDLWGKIRAGQQAAGTQALASAEDLQSTALAVSASVAERWIEMIDAYQRIALLQAQLEVNATQLELVELRFQTSKASALDVYQARHTIARTRSQLPEVEARLALSKHALNLLLGRASGATLVIDWDAAPELPPVPPTGVPSDLLGQRPDVRAAWLQIESADWNVAEAKAARLPSLALTAGASTGARQFEDLFDDWLAHLAANLTAPILDGGRRRLKVEKQVAAADQAVAAYREVVLNALKEVEDALVSEQQAREQLEAIRAELELARQTLREARNRYANGLSDYLNVTSALVSVQGLERDQITQVANQFKARIALHKALGGQLNTF